MSESKTTKYIGIALKVKDGESEPIRDPARGGSFVVTDRRPVRGNDREDFHVRGYDMRGNLLLNTWHTGESSMLLEVSCWIKRGAHPRGDEAMAAAGKVSQWKNQ
jgi:hypothetical protein